MSVNGRRKVALAYGAACHALFVVGVGAMLLNLYAGMQLGLGPWSGWKAVAANSALILQFPVVHSFLLSRRGRGLLARLAPRGLGAALSSTAFAGIASLQLILTFGLWSPSGVVWWRPQGALLWVSSGFFGLSWVFLNKALWDAGLALQTGFHGWRAAFYGRAPAFGPLPTRGLFRLIRQPVYLGFALTLWTGPVWTPDHLILALLWTVYCFVGPRWKERRSERRFGDAFRDYRARVPYMLPSLIRQRAR